MGFRTCVSWNQMAQPKCSRIAAVSVTRRACAMDLIYHEVHHFALQTKDYYLRLADTHWEADGIREVGKFALLVKDVHDTATMVANIVDDPLFLGIELPSHLARPTRWISHSRLMCVFASTRRRTSSPSASISALDALPRFKRK